MYNGQNDPSQCVRYVDVPLYMEIHVHSILAKKVHRGKKATRTPYKTQGQNIHIKLSLRDTQVPSLENWDTRVPSLENWDTRVPSLENWDTRMPSLENWDTRTPSLENWDTQTLSLENWGGGSNTYTSCVEKPDCSKRSEYSSGSSWSLSPCTDSSRSISSSYSAI